MGLHFPTIAGIDYVPADKAGKGCPPVSARCGWCKHAASPAPSPAVRPYLRLLLPQFATSVMVSGWYQDDKDDGSTLWYTGAWSGAPQLAQRQPPPQVCLSLLLGLLDSLHPRVWRMCRRGRQRPAAQAQAGGRPEAEPRQRRPHGQHPGKPPASPATTTKIPRPAGGVLPRSAAQAVPSQPPPDRPSPTRPPCP